MKYAKLKQPNGRSHLIAAALFSVSLGSALAMAQTTGGAAASGSSTPAQAIPATPATAAGTLKRADLRLLNKIAEMNRDEIALSQLAAERASSDQVRNYAHLLLQDHGKVNSELAALSARHSITLEAIVAADSLPAVGATAQVSTNAGREATVSKTEVKTEVKADARKAGTTGIAADTTVAATGSATKDQDDVNDSAAITARTLPAAGSMIATSTEAAPIPAAQLNENRAYRSLAAKTGKDFDKEYLEKMVDAHKESVDTFKDAAKDADDADVRNFASLHIAGLQEHLDKATSLKRSLD